MSRRINLNICVFSFRQLVNYSKTMSTLKRPLDDAPSSPAKKLCLEDLKTNLDALLAQATEHHEEARLAAVDSAYDLEECWKDAEERKAATETELSDLKEKQSACMEYRTKIMQNPATKMLQKASGSDVNGIDQLTQDHEKLKASLEKLNSLLSELGTEMGKCQDRLSRETLECDDLKKRHEEAEAKAEKITNLNQSE